MLQNEVKEMNAIETAATNSNGNEPSIMNSITLKRKLKSLQNKRATIIASNLSGNHQDPQLRKDESLLRKVDAEIVRVRHILQKNKQQLVSSLLVDNGVLISSDRALSQLEYLKYETSEMVYVNLDILFSQLNLNLTSLYID